MSRDGKVVLVLLVAVVAIPLTLMLCKRRSELSSPRLISKGPRLIPLRKYTNIERTEVVRDPQTHRIKEIIIHREAKEE